MDEIRRELYNEQIQEELKRSKQKLLGKKDDSESTKNSSEPNQDTSPSREEKIREAAIKHEEKLDREDD